MVNLKITIEMVNGDEYLKKSIKCWKEYFLKGDTENDEN